MIHALSIKSLVCRYKGQSVLKDLTLSVKKGDIVCLLGASGCGKTTLLKAVAGLLPLEGGTISINDRHVFGQGINLPPELRNIGMIFQDYALFPHLTVAQNVGFGLKGEDKKYIETQVKEMLSLVKLENLDARYPHQLSGGQQQRVAIARALACKPDLLLLDEPFSNIDTQVRYNLIKEIREIFKSQGVTAIFVTHNREEAFAFADKLAVMNQGVIEQYGAASALYYQPSSRFVADFMGHGSYVRACLSGNDKMDSPLGSCSVHDGTNDATNVVNIFNEQNPLKDVPNLRDVEWLIRPQNLNIYPDLSGSGVVIDTQFMGDSSRYLVDVNDQKLIVYSNQLLAIGERVRLEILAHQPILFDLN